MATQRVLAVLVGALAIVSLSRLSVQMPEKSKHKHKPPPPVDESTINDCNAQKIKSRHISCKSDGSFSPVQCMGKTCHCVNTTTGERLKPVDHKMRNEANICLSEVSCRQVNCGPRICSHGYEEGGDGCPTCRCKPHPPMQQCMTVQELLDMGDCDCSCINSTLTDDTSPKTRHRETCPSCEMEDCPVDPEDSCVTSESDCRSGSMLRIVGRHGTPECVPALRNDEMCTPVKGPGRRKPGPKGAEARAKVGMIGQEAASCQNGSICVQTDIKEYRCMVAQDTPCEEARRQDEDITCDRLGNFEPLQCKEVNSTMSSQAKSRNSRRSPMDCRCVDVSTGTTLAGTMRRIEPRGKMPDCKPRDCSVPGVRGRGKKGRKYKVKHGDTYVDLAMCRSCQCNDGNSTYLCSQVMSGVCSTVSSQNNCTLAGGLEIVHGDVLQIDCQNCGCTDGVVQCVENRSCETDTGEEGNGGVEPGETNMCDECDLMTASPVCGPDGVNYPTQCAAVYCAGIPLVDLAEGPCQSVDVCAAYPCENDTLSCLPRGGVACIGNSGCEADQLRVCLNFNDLQCPADNETTTEDEVCGSDGETYPSVCNLLQTTVAVQVVHSGGCESEECTEFGEVCGSDGVTYPNPCVLISQAVTRFDYPGACLTNGTVAEICTRVREMNLCAINETNCDSPVQPETGCCPVCGGSVTIAVDRNAITVAALLDSQIQTVDYFTTQLLELFIEVRCTVLITITDYSQIELSLVTTNNTLADLCFSQIEEISTTINGGTPAEPGARRKRQADSEELIPQVYDYTIAASTAPLVRSDDGTTTTMSLSTDGSQTTTNGAPTLQAVKLGAMVSVVLVTALLFLLQ